MINPSAAILAQFSKGSVGFARGVHRISGTGLEIESDRCLARVQDLVWTHIVHPLKDC